MAKASQTSAVRRREGIKLEERRDAPALAKYWPMIQRIVTAVVLAWGVNYVTSRGYLYKKAQLPSTEGPSSKPAVPTALKLPKGAVFMDRKALAVRHPDHPWITSNEYHTPGHDFVHDEPVFQVFDPEFLDILGPRPTVRRITEINENFMFAHEAPVWVAETDEVFFCSFAGFAPSSWNRTNVISKIDLKELKGSKDGIANVTEVTPTPLLEMTNGATWYDGKILFVNSGRANEPSSLALMEPRHPYNSTVMLDNYFGMQFNSLNDAKVHPRSKAIFVTDPTYGSILKFRPKPLLPVQVYRFDPKTGEIRVVADGFHKCNGIAFSPDGRTAYIADSGAANEDSYDSTRPQTVYAFDVDYDLRTQTFTNRRVFAYIDTVIPDGIVLDVRGNVYVSTGDGVMVFTPKGVLLGKIFIGTISANIAFAGRGRLVILAENRIYLAELGVEGMSLDFW